MGVLWWILWTPLQIRILWFGTPCILWWILQPILRTSLQIRIQLLGIRGYYGYGPILWSLSVEILAVLSKVANFYPPFELSTNQQLLSSKILKHFLTNIFIGTKEIFCFFEKGSVQSNIIHTALRL